MNRNIMNGMKIESQMSSLLQRGLASTKCSMFDCLHMVVSVAVSAAAEVPPGVGTYHMKGEIAVVSRMVD